MRTILGLAAAALVASAGEAYSQKAQGALSVVAGSATDVAGVTSRAITVLPSLNVRPDPRVKISLEAAGTKFDNSQWSATGGATANARVPVSRFAALALYTSASVTATSYDFSYSRATALPSVELSAGRLSGYVGIHGTLASSAGVRVSQGPGGLLGGPVFNQSTVSETRIARAVVYGANARLTGNGAGVVFVGVREERGKMDTMPTVDRSASMTMLLRRVSVSGNIGTRHERQARSTFGSGEMSLAMTRWVSLDLNAGGYPGDRLVGTASGRFVNLGLSLRTGRSSGEPRMPRVRGVPAPVSGFTRLAIDHDDAQRVEIAGDFTNWKFIAATRAPSGDVWFVDLRIPPGQYRYAFRIDGTTWKVPDGATAVDDGFGGKSAWLTVSGQPGNTAR